MNLIELKLLVRPAIRLLLDSVSISNPLPDLMYQITIDYKEREQVLCERIEKYLAGTLKPPAPSFIRIPKKSGDLRTWSIPAVNDQIILLACTLAISESVESKGLVNYSRVCSYEINRDPNRLALTNDQMASWGAFKEKTNILLKDNCLLQIDLQNAFASIDRGKFFAFFHDVTGGGVEVNLLRILLKSFSDNLDGLPLINESIFYLGNVYFTIVDRIVENHTDNFIRFVDDYRIFDSSRNKLEIILQAISRDIAQAGFRLNSQKVKLGDEQEVYEAFAQAGKLDPDNPGEYMSTIYDDLLDPEVLATNIGTMITCAAPLTEGMARYIMQMVRRMKIEDMIVSEWGKESPYANFQGYLMNSVPNDAVLKLLQTYTADSNYEWQLVWILYIYEFNNDIDYEFDNEIDEFLATIDIKKMGPIAQCWIKRRLSNESSVSINELHDVSYVAGGQLLYGA